MGVSASFFGMWMSSCLALFSPLNCLVIPVRSQTDCKYKGLSLGSPFHSVDLYVCPYASHIFMITYSSVVGFDIKEVSLQLCSFSTCFGYSESLAFPNKF